MFVVSINCCLTVPYSKTFFSGVHIEEEEEEEKVDNSVRGRLRRLLEKVKNLRNKKVEVDPEPQEDKKPSKLFKAFT